MRKNAHDIYYICHHYIGEIILMLSSVIDDKFVCYMSNEYPIFYVTNIDEFALHLHT